KRAASAPAGAGAGRAAALAWAGLRLAAVVLLAAGVGVGLGDGDEFDDVGCSVAQQPGGTSHGTRSAQAREGAGGGLPGSEGGSAGTSGDGGPYGGKAETLKAESRNGKVGEGESRKQKVESRNGLQDCGGEAEEGLRTTGLKDPGLQDYGGKAEEGLRTTGPRTTGLRGQEGETFPINLLKQVLDSTLEQQAAIERILDGRPLESAECGVRSTEFKRGRADGVSQPDEPNLSMAVKVLELLTALDPDSRLRKAPPIKVFLLRFRQNLSRAAIAGVCGCSESLVAIRLRAIEAKLPWHPQQLRELSAHVEAMEDAVSDSRARRIYRRGAICGDEECGSDPTLSGLAVFWV